MAQTKTNQSNTLPEKLLTISAAKLYRSAKIMTYKFRLKFKVLMKLLKLLLKVRKRMTLITKKSL